MQVVVTALLDQILELLTRVRQIVSLYEQKDPNFIAALKSWLADSERVLENHRRPQVGEIAGIRAQLLAASKGIFEKNAFSIPVAGSPRRKYYACASLLGSGLTT